jgi:hypothetical protein
MKTLYKFFKTAEVSQESPIYQKVKVEKYNLKRNLQGIIKPPKELHDFKINNARVLKARVLGYCKSNNLELILPIQQVLNFPALSSCFL